jgi:hypothetical protein
LVGGSTPLEATIKNDKGLPYWQAFCFTPKMLKRWSSWGTMRRLRIKTVETIRVMAGTVLAIVPIPSTIGEIVSSIGSIILVIEEIISAICKIIFPIDKMISAMDKVIPTIAGTIPTIGWAAPTIHKPIRLDRKPDPLLIGCSDQGFINSWPIEAQSFQE